ncbi:MAG: hypothetical protein E7111_07740 [Bacteroidales bacterium]|nr:hypothetical protein [Bacteroidales bacterium]
MKKIFIAILAVAALVSCNKDNINSDSQAENVSRFPLLKVDNLQTKTILDGTQVKFVVDDIISVFNGVVSADNHHGHCLYQCISVENGVATFQWLDGIREDRNEPWNKYEPADDVDIVATFPNRSESTSAFEPSDDGYGAGTVMIRMVASGAASDENTFAGTSMPIIASAPQGQMLKFKHTCGLLKVTLKGSAAISKVVMNGNTNISGDASVAYAVEKPVLTVVGAYSKTNTITYTYDAPVQLTAEGRDLYFGLPVGTHDVTFTFTDSDGNNMVKTAEGLTIERAVVTPTELVYQPVVEDITDLSVNGSYANCYVIQESGRYSFDAKKPDGTAVAGESAAWVWASGEKIKADGTQQGSACAVTEMITDVTISEGKVQFSIPDNFVVGNVVVGVVGADKNLVWTWHLWLTRGLADVTAEGITLMDRNLGAAYLFDVNEVTNKTELLLGKGLQYQWGRKDPILGPRGNSDETTAFASSQKCVINTSAQINNVTSWGIGGDFGGTTPEDAVKYPLTMAAAGNVPGESDAVTAWSARANSNPCPFGYRIISQAEFATLVAAGMESATFNGDNNYAQMTVAGKVAFPRLGRRPGSSGMTAKACNSGSMGIYWYDDVRATGYRFYWSSNTTVDAAKTNEYADWAATGACNAVSIRCVKVSQ